MSYPDILKDSFHLQPRWVSYFHEQNMSAIAYIVIDCKLRPLTVKV